MCRCRRFDGADLPSRSGLDDPARGLSSIVDSAGLAVDEDTVEMGERITVTGRAEIVHADLDGGASASQTVIDTADGHQFWVAGGAIDMDRGATLSVTGTLGVGGELSGLSDVRQVAAPDMPEPIGLPTAAMGAESESGELKVLVVLCGDDPGGFPPDVFNAMFDNVISPWYSEVSGGRRSFSTVVTRWLRSCDVDRKLPLGSGAAALFAGFSVPAHGRVVTVYDSHPGMNDLGRGVLGGSRSWINGAERHVGTFIHELGHNEGLSHSNAMACRSGGVTQTFGRPGECEWTEYGDQNSVMGNSKNTGSFTAPQLHMISWLSSTEVVDVDQGDVRIERFEAVGAQRIVRIRETWGELFLQRRTASGFDHDIDEGPGIEVIAAGGNLASRPVPNTVTEAMVVDACTLLCQFPNLLTEGMSLRTPDGRQIRLNRLTADGGAELSIGTSLGHLPGAPTDLRTEVVNGELQAVWTPPADPGQPKAAWYVLRLGSDVQTFDFESAGNLLDRASIDGLEGEGELSLSARSQLGEGPAAMVRFFRWHDVLPMGELEFDVSIEGGSIPLSLDIAGGEDVTGQRGVKLVSEERSPLVVQTGTLAAQAANQFTGTVEFFNRSLRPVEARFKCWCKTVRVRTRPVRPLIRSEPWSFERSSSSLATRVGGSAAHQSASTTKPRLPIVFRDVHVA